MLPPAHAARTRRLLLPTPRHIIPPATPWLAALVTGDPTGIERAFDARYFMASAELNLLNTILFVGDQGES